MPDKIRNRKGETKFDQKKAKAVNRSSTYSETKICQTCQLEFQRRKKWSSNKAWNEVKYCSKQCSSKSNWLRKKFFHFDNWQRRQEKNKRHYSKEQVEWKFYYN